MMLPGLIRSQEGKDNGHALKEPILKETAEKVLSGSGGKREIL